MIVVLGFQIKEVREGGFKSPEVCKKYPGLEWAPALYEAATALGHEFVTPEECIERVKQGTAHPDQIFWFQEQWDAQSQEYSRMRSVDVVFCLESKMYAFDFYDDLPRISLNSKALWLFNPDPKDPKQSRIYFPCFDETQKPQLPNWKDRQNKAVAVIGNKWCYHWLNLHPDSPAQNSPSAKYALDHELHSTRIEVLAMLAEMDKLDLYGTGWEHPTVVPHYYLEKMKLIGSKFRGPVKDKHELLKNYKACVVIENVDEPGYVTEKVFDSFNAGCYPIRSIYQTKLIWDWPLAEGMVSAVKDGYADTLGNHSYQSFANRILSGIQLKHEQNQSAKWGYSLSCLIQGIDHSGRGMETHL